MFTYSCNQCNKQMSTSNILLFNIKWNSSSTGNRCWIIYDNHLQMSLTLSLQHQQLTNKRLIHCSALKSPWGLFAPSQESTAAASKLFKQQSLLLWQLSVSTVCWTMVKTLSAWSQCPNQLARWDELSPALWRVWLHLWYSHLFSENRHKFI